MQTLSRSHINETPVMTSLQRALLETHTQILDTDEVKEYQRKKLRKMAVPGYVVCLVAIAIFGSAVLGFMVYGFEAVYHRDLESVFVCAGLATLGALLLSFAITTFQRYTARVRSGELGRWARISVDAWWQGVPAEVDQLHRDIAERAPLCGSWVEFLLDDPFLLFTDSEDGKAYYVAFWDEQWKTH